MTAAALLFLVTLWLLHCVWRAWVLLHWRMQLAQQRVLHRAELERQARALAEDLEETKRTLSRIPR